MANNLIILEYDSNDPTCWRDLKKKLQLQKRDGTLYILPFVDDFNDGIIQRISSLWNGHVEIINASELLERTQDETYRKITSFTADIRTRLMKIVEDRFGKKRAELFSRMWWFTSVSERNTANKAWWIFFRFEAIKFFMEQVDVEGCYFVGTGELASIVNQFCIDLRIPYFSVPVHTDRFSLGGFS